MAKTREELVAEAAAREKAMAWMAGWKCGAAFSVIPDEYIQNPEFSDGWMTGREASRRAKEVAEAKFGYTFAVIKLA